MSQKEPPVNHTKVVFISFYAGDYAWWANQLARTVNPYAALPFTSGNYTIMPDQTAMPTVRFVPKAKDAFILEANGQQIGEMIVDRKDDILSVYHTEVHPSQKGKGLGKKLVEAMAAHVRQNHLKVDAHCPFVKAQFKDNPGMYADIVK